MSTDKIVQNMEVIGADGVHVGTVDGVADSSIRLAKRDSGEWSSQGPRAFHRPRVCCRRRGAKRSPFGKRGGGGDVRGGAVGKARLITGSSDDPSHARGIKKREAATETRFRTHTAHQGGLGRQREEKALASKLDQLRAMTTVVADTGNLGAAARLKPVDCTANPTIVLKAVDASGYRDVVDEALA